MGIGKSSMPVVWLPTKKEHLYACFKNPISDWILSNIVKYPFCPAHKLSNAMDKCPFSNNHKKILTVPITIEACILLKYLVCVLCSYYILNADIKYMCIVNNHFWPWENGDWWSTDPIPYIHEFLSAFGAVA